MPDTVPTGPTMKIGRIEAFAVSLPLTKPVKMSFEEVKRADNLLVRVETADGATGWGESASAPTMTGETAAGMLAAVRHLAPLLTGTDANDIPAVMARANQYLYGNQAAKAAIEIALHDALGKARGLPIYELLGGKRRDRVSLLRLLGTGSTAGDAAEARRRMEEGYVAFKIKVGIASPEADAERTIELCKVMGDDVLICADANQGWTVAQAITYVKAVEHTRLVFFEQPIAGDDLAGMATVARASRIQIGSDEGLHSIEDLRRHHETGAAHGGSLKTIKLGGIRPVWDAALLCEELGMKVNLACKIAESSVATSAILHLAAAIPSLAWGVSLTSEYLSADLVKTPLASVRGHMPVPTGAGLGVEVDESLVRQYTLSV
jgi:L-alanine-DL-glutamate epimerase-like enolase superfamily enzyme